MRKLVFFALVCASAAEAPMGNTTDWWAFGGNALRDGWEKSEQRFTKDEVKDFRLLWQQRLGNLKGGVGAVMPPVVLGRLIGYRGFKELAFVAGSSNLLWAIDADLDRMYWQKDFQVQSVKKSCTADLTSEPALPGPAVFHAPVPGQPTAKPRSVNRFGGARPVYLLTGDGLLRQLQQSDGSDFAKPRPFVPPGVAAQALNVSDDVIFTSTKAGCGQPAAVWSMDLLDENASPKTIKLGADPVGMMGVVVDGDGTVFVETGDGPLDPVNGKYGGTLLALSKDLTVGPYFIMPENTDSRTKSTGMNVTAPVVFSYKGAEMLVTTGKDGRLYLLRTSDLGTGDHHHYIAQSIVIPAMDGDKAHGIWGAIASWIDAAGTRYVLAPVWGPLSGDMQAAVPNTDAPSGSIVVFKVEDDSDGVPALKPVWVSTDMTSPGPPVIAKGVVFAVANGSFRHTAKGEMARKGTHAILYAFDGETGKQMYSTGDEVKTAGNLAGLTVANGRVYFATVDNIVQVFGKYIEP